MNRAHLREKLHLSGIDSAAAQLSRRYALGFEVTAFCMAAALEDSRQIKSRDIAVKRYRQTVAMARRLGIRRIVIHDGYIPFVYFPEWFVEQSVRFWRDFLPEVPQDMTIALENVMDDGPDMLAAIMEGVNDPRLGVCLDVGHANTTVSKTPPLDWIAPLSPWLRHVHIHNNFGDWDLHNPLGEGNIPMEQVLDALLTACPTATFTIENMNCAPSLDWLAAQGYLGEITR